MNESSDKDGDMGKMVREKMYDDDDECTAMPEFCDLIQGLLVASSFCCYYVFHYFTGRNSPTACTTIYFSL